MAGEALGRNRLRRRCRKAAVVVVAVVVVASCSGSSGNHGAGSGPRSELSGSRSITIPEAGAARLALGGGAHLLIPAGAMTPGASVNASYRNPPRGGRGDQSPLARPVKLVSNPAGALHGDMTLEFPVPPRHRGDGGFGIATYDQIKKTWTPVPAVFDAARYMVVAQIQHFSWWDPFSWDWVSIGARVNQRVGEVVGKRSSAATCSRGQPVPAWVSTLVGVTNDPAIALRDCAEGDGDVLAVEISNNRPYSMYLHYGSPVKWGWHEAGDSEQDRARNALGDRFAGPDDLYIPPLGRASIGISKTVGYRAFVAGVGWRSLAIDVFDNLIGSAMGKIPRAGSCLSGLFAQSFGDFSPGKVRDGVKELLDCVTREAAALGYFDSATISQLESMSHKLGLLGAVLTLGDVEWKLLDLYVDHVVVADSGIGAGFSVLGKSSASVSQPNPQPTEPPDVDASLTDAVRDAAGEASGLRGLTAGAPRDASGDAETATLYRGNVKAGTALFIYDPFSGGTPLLDWSTDNRAACDGRSIASAGSVSSPFECPNPPAPGGGECPPDLLQVLDATPVPSGYQRTGRCESEADGRWAIVDVVKSPMTTGWFWRKLADSWHPATTLG